LNRRKFCIGMVAVPSAVSAISGASAQAPEAATWDHYRRIRLVLNDPLEHPFFYWPRTLLSYPIEFRQTVDLNRLVLTRLDTGERVPIQFSAVMRDGAGVRSATLHFCSDLPSGGRREFVLSAAESPLLDQPQVKEVREGKTIVLDSGAMRVRIPASQEVHGAAPGPILQVSRGGAWIGNSVLDVAGDKVIRITANRTADGPLFIAYEITYDMQDGPRYIARIQSTGGFDFVRLQEDMEGMRPGARGFVTSTWTGFDVTHRQAPNHPIPVVGFVRSYDDYPWERVDEAFPLHTSSLPGGQLPFELGIYQTWTAFHSGTSANFWDLKTGDALGVFIDKVDGWQDHEYANHLESETLQVRYYHEDGKFFWKWPVSRGSRSTCIAFYDHAKDKEAMHELETSSRSIKQDGLSYDVGLAYTSHTMFLQNRYGTLDLNCVKDWVLEYPFNLRRPAVVFENGIIKDANDLERRVLTSQFVCSLPIFGTRENGATGSIPGRNIVNFSPVPSRQILGWWVDGFNRFNATMSEGQRSRVTAMFLLIAYVTAADEFMPLVPMLSGHPNFMADVKAAPPAMSFLFPDHPMASTWADLWEKSIELNTRYNTRPAVKTWDAAGGRWTENLGTYVWAFLRPSARVDFLLRQYDGRERFVTPQLAEMAEWLVNSLSAPFLGETPEAFVALQTEDRGHGWGAVALGAGPHRVHPPQGAHSERRIPPRSMWYLGTCLRHYAPMAAEHAMWAARPTNQDMEDALGKVDAWNAMYRDEDNRGTNPHLRSSKSTGYGITLRSAVGSADEVSVHLQQIDEGPNYRWGLSAEGGCGVLYFFAAGKAYSFNASEDVGDRDDQDTDFCTNFGVYKDGVFRSIGMNVLSRPFYDLGVGQFAEIVPREGPTRYSAPEYVGRSVLLAGHDYFVLYDQVLNRSVDHRLSWFVRRGSELPTIKLVRGWTGVREFQRTEIQTNSTTGVWIDGVGDSMAVVSHRKDIETETTPFGCRVRAPGIDDLVFRDPEPIHYKDGATRFEGTSGLIRRTKDRTEFAMFHGTVIGIPEIAFSTADTDLGIAGSIVAGQSARGEYFATKAASVNITVASLSDTAVFYVDGEALTGRREANALILDLKEGNHHWELTDSLPVPIAPRIVRTENYAGGARVILDTVAAATKYRLECSKDSGSTWTSLGLQSDRDMKVSGLSEGQKVHVRAVALNSKWESDPGSEYPIYVTSHTPQPPDGLRVELSDGAAALSWGEVLGVIEYRLYARTSQQGEFQVLYRGLNRTYVDRRASVRAVVAMPGDFEYATHRDVIEYCVTAVNGNGEGARSRTADTNPASWRNWDPKPGEPFRRLASFSPDLPPPVNEWPPYYPT